MAQRTFNQELYRHQILRLAKMYVSKPVTPQNIAWHNRVGNMQSKLLKEKIAFRYKKTAAI
jgi:hypothetical protein